MRRGTFINLADIRRVIEPTFPRKRHLTRWIIENFRENFQFQIAARSVRQVTDELLVKSAAFIAIKWFHRGQVSMSMEL